MKEGTIMKDLRSMVEQMMDAVPRRDFVTIRQMLHPDYSFTSGDGQRQEGIEAGIAVIDMYTTAFPDMEMDIQHMNLAGNIVITEFIVRGTHQGELFGLAPTNRRVKIQVCNIVEFRDGKVFAEREYFDTLFMMQQLGLEVGHTHA